MLCKNFRMLNSFTQLAYNLARDSARYFGESIAMVNQKKLNGHQNKQLHGFSFTKSDGYKELLADRKDWNKDTIIGIRLPSDSEINGIR